MPISTITSNSLTPTSDLTINGLTVGKGIGNNSFNTVVGNSALANGSQSGSNNTAFGYGTLFSNTSGSSGTAIGTSALLVNTSGSFNTAVGHQSLTSNATGSNNTAVGYQAGFSYNSSGGTWNTFLGAQSGYSQTSGQYNTYVGLQSGYSMTTGGRNTIIGGYSGNQADLDIRTSSNRIVLADGDGNPKIYMSDNGVTRLFNAYQNTLTSNSKGGTVTILPRDVFFPPSYFTAIDTCTIIVNCVASEGTAGGYARTDILHVNYRFGYNLTSLASNAADGISVSNWTYSFDSNGLRVTQNWGASGGSLGTRWAFFITGCLFQG